MGSKFRLRFLFAGFALCSALLIFRAFQLQVVPSKNVERLAQKQLKKTIEIVGRRGAIRDRRGRDLAVSVNTSSIYVNPHLVKNIRSASKQLAQITGMPQGKIAQKIKAARRRKFIWLDRQLDHAQLQRLKAIDLKNMDGVGVLPEYRRDYPNSSMAAQVLGYVSIDAKGLAGLEYYYDERMSGSKKTLEVQRDAKGRPIFSHLDQIRLDDMRGDDLNLTIDAALQSRVEQSLEMAVQKHEADSALAIVMNPKTGEILSLAHFPTFDPNKAGNYSLFSRRNRSVTDPVEPGSVLKPFVVATAIDKKIVTPQSRISGGGGKIKIGRKTITESDKKHYFQTMTIRDLIRHSSNVGTVNLQRKMGFEAIAERFLKLGFKEGTGIDLPAESRGIFHIPSKKQELERATISYGHGIALTPMQIVRAWSVFGNDGYLVTPKIIKGPTEEPAKERIFSSSTVNQMVSMLEDVVAEGGTGVEASVDGYKVAGKTGTSLKLSETGGYQSGAYWSAFAGLFPSRNPEIVVYVAVDNPRKEGKYAGAVAAPLFADIAKAYLGVGLSRLSPVREIASKESTKPSSTRVADNVGQAYASMQKKLMPQLEGLSLTQALRLLEQESMKVEVESVGRIVEDQIPEAGSLLKDTQRVLLKLKD